MRSEALTIERELRKRAPRQRQGHAARPAASAGQSRFAIRMASTTRRRRAGSAPAEALALVAELLVERDRGRRCAGRRAARACGSPRRAPIPPPRRAVRVPSRVAGARRRPSGRSRRRARSTGCGSRAIESRPTISPSTSATSNAASGCRRTERTYRRSSATLRQRESASSQPSGSAPTALRSATSAAASAGSAGRTRRRHSTTTPAPPRRGSPAAASVPSAQISTAAAPPKKRLRRRQRTTS